MGELTPPRNFEDIDVTIVGDSHVRAYRETNGEQGYLWNGATILLLTTQGRRSGQPKTVPLIFVRDGEKFVVVASLAGAPQHPAWYLNVAAEPRVQVQVKGDVFEARARTADAAERERLWPKAVQAWPQYDDYQSKTSRQFPVVILEPART
jgi:deazaflavin-dependent oxidoreductase (nitroreductase family)